MFRFRFRLLLSFFVLSFLYGRKQVIYSGRTRRWDTCDQVQARGHRVDREDARLRALLRRTASQDGLPSRIEVRGLEIDLSTRSAVLGGLNLDLRRMEFELLAHLAGEPSRVFTREEILRTVWGYRSTGSTRTLDTHASRLRGKLQAIDDRRWMIGIRGVGYRLI